MLPILARGVLGGCLLSLGQVVQALPAAHREARGKIANKFFELAMARVAKWDWDPPKRVVSMLVLLGVPLIFLKPTQKQAPSKTDMETSCEGKTQERDMGGFSGRAPRRSLKVYGCKGIPKPKLFLAWTLGKLLRHLHPWSSGIFRVSIQLVSRQACSL